MASPAVHRPEAVRIHYCITTGAVGCHRNLTCVLRLVTVCTSRLLVGVAMECRRSREPRRRLMVHTLQSAPDGERPLRCHCSLELFESPQTHWSIVCGRDFSRPSLPTLSLCARALSEC